MKAFRIIVLIASAILISTANWADDQPTELVVSLLPARLELNPLHAYTSAEAQIFTGIYEGLFTYDPRTLDPVPAVARSWEKSADGKTYTFHLRSDARYSDGTQVKAGDFKAAWLRMITPDQKAEYSSLFDAIKGAKDFRLGKSKDPDTVGIRTKGDQTLEIELDSPAAYFLKLLCHHSFAPLAPTMANVPDYSAAKTIVGNGPYYIESSDAAQMVLRKSDYYWDKASVSIPTVRILFDDDSDGVTNQYNEEHLHWLTGAMNLDKIQSRGHIQINSLFATHYFYFSSSEKPWSDPKVRRGLALLMPWAEIRSGNLPAAQTLVYPVFGYPAVKGMDAANIEEGKKALEDAGFANGEGLPKLTIAVPDGDDAKRIATLMEKAIKDNTKIDVQVNVIDADKYFDLMRQGGYVIGSSTWIGDFADPLTFLQMWTSDSNLNDAGYADPAYDKLIESSMSLDGKDRYETLGKAETILLDSAEVMPIYYNLAINVIDTGYIAGWYGNALDIHPFKTMKFGIRKAMPSVVDLGVDRIPASYRLPTHR
jgi:oligopeptide transport system substrate-binding protein